MHLLKRLGSFRLRAGPPESLPLDANPDVTLRFAKRFLALDGWEPLPPFGWANCWIRSKKDGVHLNLIVHDRSTLRLETIVTDVRELSDRLKLHFGILSVEKPCPDLTQSMKRIGLFVLSPRDLARADVIARSAAETFLRRMTPSISKLSKPIGIGNEISEGTGATQQQPLPAENIENDVGEAQVFDESAKLASAGNLDVDGERKTMLLAIDDARRNKNDAELDFLLRNATQVLVTEAWPIKELAWLSHRRRDFEAQRIWGDMLAEKFPHLPDGAIITTFANRLLGNIKAAQECIKTAKKRFPDSPGILKEAAWVALINGCFDEAQSLASQLRASSAEQEAGYLIGAKTFLAQKDLSSAEALLSQAREDGNGSYVLRLLAAETALAKGCFEAALSQVTPLLIECPNDQGALIVKLSALKGLRRMAEAFEFANNTLRLGNTQEWLRKEVEKLSGLVDSTFEQELQPSLLLANFESLGGSAPGCEFGLVQRKVGIEPIGLLRWTSVSKSSLFRLLDCKFAGLGTDEHTRITLSNYGRDDEEFILMDTHFNIRTHTFIRASESSAEVERDRGRRRLAFLARKITEDITEGKKIFVYKNGDEVFTSDDLIFLSTRLGSYSKALFLYVTKAGAGEQAGTIKVIAPNLVVGLIAFHAINPAGGLAPADASNWLRICRQAHKYNLQRNITTTGSAPDLSMLESRITSQT